MMATPLLAPLVPAGPPVSGTFESSTPTPQQLAKTKSEKRLSRTVRCSGKIRWSARAKIALEFHSARVSRWGASRPAIFSRVSDIYIYIYLESTVLAAKHVKCQVRLGPRIPIRYDLMCAYAPVRRYKYYPRVYRRRVTRINAL